MKAMTTLVLSVLWTTLLHAQWIPDGTLVSDTNTNFDWPRVVADNHGGAYIVYRHMFWTEENLGAHIFVQRITRDGRLAWPSGIGGIKVTKGGLTNRTPQIISHGEYAFIVWFRGVEVMAQKIDTAGTLLWDPEGIRVNTRRNGMSPSIALDSCGGLFVASYCEDPVVNGNPVWIQRLDANGRRMWTDTGATVSNRASFVDPRTSAQVFTICTPQPGSPLVAWTERSTPQAGRDLQSYIQKLDEDGRPLWKQNGIALTDTDSDSSLRAERGNLFMVEDGRGGAFIGWSVYGAGQTLQHVDSNGTRLLGSEGRWMFEGSANDMLSDGRGGLIMASAELISPGAPSFLKARHLNYDLEPLWGDSTGLFIARDGPVRRPPDRDQTWMAGDWPRGIFIHGQTSFYQRVWAQYIDRLGRCRWGDDGILLTSDPPDNTTLKRYSDIATTAPGEAIVVWNEYRSDYNKAWTIRAAKINQDGLVGVYALAAPGTASPSLQLRAPYPRNPGTMISGETTGSGMLSLMIYDIQGRRMGPVTERMCDPGPFTVYLDTSGLSAGSYFIQAVQGASTVSAPIIITRIH